MLLVSLQCRCARAGLVVGVTYAVVAFDNRTPKISLTFFPQHAASGFFHPQGSKQLGHRVLFMRAFTLALLSLLSTSSLSSIPTACRNAQQFQYLRDCPVFFSPWLWRTWQFGCSADDFLTHRYPTALTVVSSPSAQIMKIVDEARAKYGLKPLGELRAAGTLKDILTQQKEETVDALSVVARPVEVCRLGWLSSSRGAGGRMVIDQGQGDRRRDRSNRRSCGGRRPRLSLECITPLSRRARCFSPPPPSFAPPAFFRAGDGERAGRAEGEKDPLRDRHHQPQAEGARVRARVRAGRLLPGRQDSLGGERLRPSPLQAQPVGVPEGEQDVLEARLALA